MTAPERSETQPHPAPSEWGGEGYSYIEYGHRFVCGEVDAPDHIPHEEYSDSLRISTWPWDGRQYQERDPHECTSINRHPVEVVQRTVTFGPWVADQSGSQGGSDV